MPDRFRDVEPYLERIRYEGPRDPTAGTLRTLHRAHLLAVPFENLDIHLGHRIGVELDGYYEKVVRDRRGGFCYELNGVFAWLLRALGFEVTLLSARVHDGKRFGPDFDHLTLRVDLGEPWLADVGFGDSFVEPLRLADSLEQEQEGHRYRLARAGEEWTLSRQGPGAKEEPQYRFTTTPRRLEEFGPMCEHQQTSPESTFTRKRVCSLLIPGGRLTLTDGRLVTTRGVEREERTVAGAAEYRSLLEVRFGIDLAVLPSGWR